MAEQRATVDADVVRAPAGKAQNQVADEPGHVAVHSTAGTSQGRAAPHIGAVQALQRAAGNRAMSRWLTARSRNPSPAPSPVGSAGVMQRVALQDGPPLAPGNYRYGDVIIGLSPAAVRSTLTDKAAKDGLPAERIWKDTFVGDMRAQSGKPHSYDDPDAKQTVSVEPTMASRAEQAQGQLESQVTAVQTQFQQELLGSVRTMLGSSEKKLQAEGHRYGFPDDESIFRPKPTTVGQATLQPSMPESAELRGAMDGAKTLLDGKKKVKAARDTINKSGPILGDAMRPTVLEPALKEYHQLRETTCKKYPILASAENNEDRLTALAGGATTAGGNGPAAAVALVNAKEELRKELADKLSNISYVRERMGEPDKITGFWLDQRLRDNTKRNLGIGPATIQDAAVQDKVKTAKEDAEFEAKLKAALGFALLVASFVPGVAPIAGAAGVLLGAADVYGAFQQYYWEQAAAGTAMEKAEAISQSDPSLFGLALSIAGGLLEGVAEAKALEAAIGVFKFVSAAYKEARAAAVVARMSSGAGRAAGAAEAAAAVERLRTAAGESSGHPELGEQIVRGMSDDVQVMANQLEGTFKIIKDPALIELIRKSDRKVTAQGDTLMDLATKDPYQLAKDYQEFRKLDPKDPGAGKPFEDWLRDRRGMPDHGILHEPAGLVEYGMSETEAQRSFDAMVREDPTREAAVWRDPATGEHVAVQGGPGFVEHEWMADPENMRNGAKPNWELMYHQHPNSGKAIDRVPSPGDFGHISMLQKATDAGGPPRPVRSTVVWNDPASGLRYQTEFGFTPGVPRPYWVRYRVEDGTFRVATFAEHPSGAGQAEYLAWAEQFSGRASDPVPGGNIPPELQEEAPPTVREPRK